MSDAVALDSGAIIALSREKREAVALLKRYRADGAYLIVPAPVLAETLRGRTSDAAIHRALSLAAVVDVTPADARDAGSRLGAARSAATVDAMIVASAVRAGAQTIVTGDPSDMLPLVDAGMDVVAI